MEDTIETWKALAFSPGNEVDDLYRELLQQKAINNQLQKFKNENIDVFLIEKHRKYAFIIRQDLTNDEFNKIKHDMDKFINDNNQHFVFINGKTCELIELE